ncbi:GNAT family N-acetyltransferase [Peteryoungia desertarenae]|uniref:GNAT family N-acetyltransferase n=1 Tax=Peteryoungia desertarenae TaxID=1813451 RepID=A0ABX6QPN0_9HYPH|nr:GNAT family N-acetyltransferase [Peteryoungia desertarenae]QLF70564.1 GNAT family N-acetyltransferase [Peteryoungia desertarenae]
MKKNSAPLPLGYSPLPPGTIANVVTCLEMTARPTESSRHQPEAPGTLCRLRAEDLTLYRSIFRAVGEDWLWMSRLVMSDEDLSAILADDRVEAYAVMDGEGPVGLLELDFRETGTCELAFFGLVPDAIGKGAGRWLMNQALERAWSAPVHRFWVHTCSFDHPAALGFYQRSGFRPYASFVEVIEDPRLSGKMRRDAARHVPLIAP